MNIEMHEVQSSLIHAIGYDVATKVMAVQFKSRGNPGALYHYLDVPEKVYPGVAAAESVGKAFGAFVKNAGYKFARVAEPPVGAKATATKVVMDPKTWPFPKVDE